MPNKHYELDSILVAIVRGMSELASTIDTDQGLHESSLNLRLGDMRALFDEAVATIEAINEEVKVQD
jgi:hypothetical protein